MEWGGYAVSASVSARLEWFLSSRFGVYVAPQGSFALKKSAFFKQVSAVSPAVKRMGTGVNCQIGVFVCF